MFRQILFMREMPTASFFPSGPRSRAIVSVAMMSALVAAHSMAAYGADPADRLPHAERRPAPIVDGRRLQPTPANLPRPEMSARSAAIVDELYRQLINSRDGR